MVAIRLVLAFCLKLKGELLVARVKGSYDKGIYYSVNPETGRYSFWRWRLFQGVFPIETDLTKSQAQFKLLLLSK